MTQQLTQLKVDEVSLVDRAANRRCFLLMKSAAGTGEDDMATDELKAIETVTKIDKAGFGPSIEALAADKDPTETEELLKGVADADKSKVRAAIRVLGGPLAKTMLTPKTVEKIVEKTVVPGVVKKADGTYDLSGIKDEASRQAVEIALKSADEATARSTRIEKERRHEVTVAKVGTEYRHLPGVKADDFASVIEKAQESLSKDEFAKLDTVLKAASETIRKGEMFTEIGRTASGVAGSAAAEIEAKAADLRKANPKLTPEGARAQIYKSDRPLYDRYEAERGGKRVIQD